MSGLTVNLERGGSKVRVMHRCSQASVWDASSRERQRVGSDASHAGSTELRKKIGEVTTKGGIERAGRPKEEIEKIRERGSVQYVGVARAVLLKDNALSLSGFAGMWQ